MLSNDWRPAGTLTWEGDTLNALPIALQTRFTARIIRTRTSTPGVTHRWRRAGYLHQVNNADIDGDELVSVTIPLNKAKIFAMPLLYDSYQLIFVPVRWLPSLSLRLWEYTGPLLDPAMINELSFMR